MTLSEFIRRNDTPVIRFPRSAWVDEPGFESLYVRIGPRYVEGQIRQRVFTIANVTAKEPGQGAFKNFVSRIRHDYPDLPIFVEGAMDERFQNGLERLGFRRLSTDEWPPHYLREPS